MGKVNYYAYSDQSIKDKDKLAQILNKLKGDFPYTVTDLDALVETGDFERISRLILPQTLIHILSTVPRNVDDTSLVTYFLHHSPENISSIDDLGKFINSNNIHITSDISDNVDKATFINNFIDNRDASFVQEDDDSNYEEPISDGYWMNQVTENITMPVERQIDQFVLTTKLANDVADKFVKQVHAAFGDKALLPVTERQKMYLYQMFIPFYRITVAKTSLNNLPVIYPLDPLIVSLDQQKQVDAVFDGAVQTLAAIGNNEGSKFGHIIEKFDADNKIESVKGTKVFRWLMSCGSVKDPDDYSKTSFPTRDDPGITNRYRLDMNDQGDDGKITAYYKFDVIERE